MTRALQKAVSGVYVDPALVSYAVAIAAATRDPAAHGFSLPRVDSIARRLIGGMRVRAAGLLERQALGVLAGEVEAEAAILGFHPRAERAAEDGVSARGVAGVAN